MICSLPGVLAIGRPARAQPPDAAASARASPRETLMLTDRWRFLQADPAGAEDPSYADGTWTEVSVPHTWNRVGTDTAAGGAPRALNQSRGVGWYRLQFEVPRRFAHRRVYVQFDAASERADVWLNGVRLGGHRGGFSRFRLDATAALSPGQRNTLAVKTDNSTPAPGSSTADILPLAGDFWIYGGLYRPVSLIATAPVHIGMLDHGGPGVGLSTKKLADGAADIAVETKIRNDQGRRAAVVLTVTFKDSGGRVVASLTRRLDIGAHGDADVAGTVRIHDVHLWQGVDDPYLYQTAFELRTPAGVRLDRVTQRFGVRQIRIDPERGLFLNDRSIRLHGVALHQDREGKGWAVSEADQREDLEMIRDLGANSIRFTHYQHSDTLNDLSDELGLLNWAEIPLVSKWTLGGATQPTDALIDNAKQQMVELIRQSSNHASIAVWGLANEVDFGSVIPAAVGGGTNAQTDPRPLLGLQRQTAQAEDPGRPSTIANCCYGRPGSPSVIDAADLDGANRYFGWYTTVPADLNADLDRMRAAYPSIPLAVSEYGAGASIVQHTDNPLGGPVDPRGHVQPEEYQSRVHELTWPILAAKPFLWGSWLTFMFDFSTPGRTEGDSVNINTKGLASYDRKTRKDAFFFYRANWNPAPTVYIASRRQTQRVLPLTELKVYSNARTTEAWINGRSLGALTECPQRICRWPAVALAPGANLVKAAGEFASGTVSDSVSWTLTVGAGVYRIDCGSIEGMPGPEGPHGSDDFFSGGAAAAINPFMPVRAAVAPVHRDISGTPFEALLNTYRKGRFSYVLPLANGMYRVRLRFVEPEDGPGARVFSVTANGAPAIVDLDVAAAAGGPLKALERSFVATVANGALNLDFAGSSGDAIVSSIDVEPAATQGQ